MHTFTRRSVIANMLRAAACTAVGTPVCSALAQAYGNPNQRRVGLGQITQAFQQQFHVPAMSIAISKNGRFVYDHAGGMADREHMTQAQQDNLLYFGDISTFPIKMLERDMPARCLSTEQGYRDEYVHDLTVQPSVNSEITMRKMRLFNWGMRFILMGGVVLLLPSLRLVFVAVKSLW
jgi:hypothetical protein